MSLSDLAELELGDIEAALSSRGCPAYHARQIYRWVYRRGETDFDRMTDLGKKLRARLREEFSISSPTVVGDEVSSDGTRKLLLQLAAVYDGT